MSQPELFDIDYISTQPLISWVGGKRWIVPLLMSRYKGERLVEPFAGGLAATFALRPSRVRINDLNWHLITFYRALRRGLTIEFEMLNEEKYYYTRRRKFNFLSSVMKRDEKQGKELDPYVLNELAGLFYYLNRTGYKGLCRYNKQGNFNSPFGHGKPTYVRDFTPYAAMFAKWDISCGDFESIDVVDGDFLFVDPPYDDTFTGYSAGGFKWDDQLRLVKWLEDFDCPIIATNNETDRIVELYEDNNFHIERARVSRTISATENEGAIEIIATRGC